MDIINYILRMRSEKTKDELLETLCLLTGVPKEKINSFFEDVTNGTYQGGDLDKLVLEKFFKD